MDLIDLPTVGTLAAVLLLAVVLLVKRRRAAASRVKVPASRRGGSRGRARPQELDTVAAWPPEAARVMTTREREAWIASVWGHLLRNDRHHNRRVGRVPPRHDVADWMQRVGQLSADLLICDGVSRVLAVVDIRSTAETDRAKRRHDRLGRVLRAAGVRVHVWQDASLPSVTEVRSELGVSRERVRQIQIEALKRLRDMLEREGFSLDSVIE